MAIPPPPGHHTLTPAATVRGARAVITFMETAFGGELIETYEAPGGLIAHAEVKVRDCVFMLGDVMEGDPMPAMVSFFGEPADWVMGGGCVRKLKTMKTIPRWIRIKTVL